MNDTLNLEEDRPTRIRALNDRLRTTGVGGRILITRSIVDLGPSFLQAAVLQMQAFDRFDNGNDPYREHDFGSLLVEGETLFFKIDYYDPSMSAGTEDPSDPTRCARVLTLMLAADY